MGIFSYDSKLMQILSGLADMMLLNVLYILCSFPLVTMGAAQAGLYNGLRDLHQERRGYVKAFFRGFRNGFWTVTVPWCILLALALGLMYILGILVFYEHLGFSPPSWLAIMGLGLILILLSVMTPFHARFSCTGFQLVRNSLVVALRFPLRSIGMTVLTWLPVALLLTLGNVFWRYAMIIALLYYSVSFVVNMSLFGKPVKQLTEIYLEAQADASEAKNTDLAPDPDGPNN